MQPCPVLKSARFSLEPVVWEDQAFVFEGLSHPDVVSFYGVSYKTLDETAGQMEFYERVWREKSGAYWKVVDEETGENMGVCGFSSYNPVHQKAEIGAWLLPAYWGKGIMTEVMPLVIKFAFENWELNRLEGVVEPRNIASANLAKRLGFVYEGTLREAEMKNGKPISLEYYSMLRSEFLNR